MGLRQCEGCERHVREGDTGCPFCGAEGRNPVPAPRSAVSRKAWVGAQVAVAVTISACSVSAVPVYGAPIDPDELFPDSGPRDSGKDVETDGPLGPAPACFSNLGERVRGTVPTPHRGVCTAQDVADAERSCVSAAHTGTACTDFAAAHPDCARCIFGPPATEVPAASPIGALVPSGPTTVMPNLGACASLVLGKPECAVPITKASACTAGSCSACAPRSSEKANCEAYAQRACVGAVEASCEKALLDGFSKWGSTCQGANVGASFAKVAWYLCGDAPSDAGAADAASD